MGVWRGWRWRLGVLVLAAVVAVLAVRIHIGSAQVELAITSDFGQMTLGTSNFTSTELPLATFSLTGPTTVTIPPTTGGSSDGTFTSLNASHVVIRPATTPTALSPPRLTLLPVHVPRGTHVIEHATIPRGGMTATLSANGADPFPEISVTALGPIRVDLGNGRIISLDFSVPRTITLLPQDRTYAVRVVPATPVETALQDGRVSSLSFARYLQPQAGQAFLASGIGHATVYFLGLGNYRADLRPNETLSLASANGHLQTQLDRDGHLVFTFLGGASKVGAEVGSYRRSLMPSLAVYVERNVGVATFWTIMAALMGIFATLSSHLRGGPP